MICKHLDLKFEAKETYWWCSEFDKYTNHRDCTILPCKAEVSLAGCEKAELPDRYKVQLKEAKRG